MRLRYWTSAVAMLLAPCVVGQDVFLDQWQKARAQNPAEISFSISLPKTTFYVGEAIPVSHHLSASAPNKYLGIIPFGREICEAGFVINPDARHVAPTGGATGNRGARMLRPEPVEAVHRLNDCVRFVTPATYRIYADVRVEVPRIYPETGAASVLHSISNVLTITVEAAPPEWVAEQIAEARVQLAKPAAPDAPGVKPELLASEQRRRVLETLAFLDTPESLAALVANLASVTQEGNGWFSLLDGTAHPGEVYAMLDARLSAPEQAVTWDYLNVMWRLGLAAGVVQRDTNPQREYLPRLAAALPEKRVEVRGACLWVLMNGVRNGQLAPELRSPVETVLRDSFAGLPASYQLDFLQGYWDVVRNPMLVPVLKQLYEAAGFQSSLVLERLLELAPEEARPLVLEELRHPKSQGDWRVLGKLKDETLPELNEEFVANVAGSSNLSLVARYAPAELLDRIKATYLRSKARAENPQGVGARPQHYCPSGLMPYFLKYDAEFGEQETRRMIDQCSTMGISSRSIYQGGPVVFPQMQSPALERLAIEHLMKGPVQVKTEATVLMGAFGTPAAREPLWSAMQAFHDWWQGRALELERQNVEGREEERAEQTAIVECDGQGSRAPAEFVYLERMQPRGGPAVEGDADGAHCARTLDVSRERGAA